MSLGESMRLDAIKAIRELVSAKTKANEQFTTLALIKLLGILGRGETR